MSDCRHAEGCPTAEERGISCCKNCPEAGDCNSACVGQSGCCETCTFRRQYIEDTGMVSMTMEDHLAEGERMAAAVNALHQIAEKLDEEEWYVPADEAKKIALDALAQIEQPLPGAARWQAEKLQEEGKLF